MATIVALADAVVTELNNNEWSLSFVARRHYRPRFEPADLKALQVSIVPRSLVIEAANRTDDSTQYQIDIAIQQKLDDDPSEEINPLLSLAEEIVSHFFLRRPAAMPRALCIRVENDPIYAIEHLEELRCFTSIVSLTYRMIESE